MDKEVDVQLFITCRLCLEESGSYQIIPCIRGQINFCYGIDIDTYDGLPQLICKKCKSKLAEYYATKIVYVHKQKQLLNKVRKENEDKHAVPPKIDCLPKEMLVPADVTSPGDPPQPAPPSPDVTPPQTAPSVPGVTPPGDPPQAPPLRPDVTSPGDTSQHASLVTDVIPTSDPPQPTPPALHHVARAARQVNKKKRKPSWKKEFYRHFVCTICSMSFLTEKAIKKHSPSHKRFINKHEKIFKTFLTVRLNKIDKKKNRTGGLRNVVYNKDKIIEESKSQYHYSFYLKKDNCQLDQETDENENVAAKRLRVRADSSDEEIIKGKKRKTGRLESTSSTQTVILEENKDSVDAANTDNQSSTRNDAEIVNTECINLDDTSSDCPKHSTLLEKKRKLPQRRQVKAEVSDYHEIQQIVTMCHRNYIKKVQADTDGSKKSTFSESSLKHKVLSLGRKVLNKQGFICTGLLRYMEHKDLDVTWTPNTNDMQKKGSSFVRIMTKLISREDSENDDASWKNLHNISFCRDSGAEAEVVATAHEDGSNNPASLQPARADEDPLSASAPCDANDLNYRNKLLNKTPVANPRQLPKKNNISEAKLVAADDAAATPPNLICDGLEDAQVDDENMCMPIITSTTSLSLNVSEVQKQEHPVTEKPAPRIKVKPASELMTARALNNQETAEDIWAFNLIQSSLPHHLTSTAVSVDSPKPDSHSDVAISNHQDEQPRSLEYILLDSPQFPNTKTLAPFQYFRKVLHVHGLQLMDLNEDLPDHFSCLIKFRLMLKQELKRPIAVLLSLYCSKDTFCFTFKDTNYKQFDPNQLPAFWQWELLKIYKTDLVDKILQNALKVGKETHDYTRLFLCLLKSINLIKEA